MSNTIAQRAARMDDRPRDERRAVRAAATKKAIAGHDVKLVVDVGCGYGQDLYPFLDVPGASAIGIEVLPEYCKSARALLRTDNPGHDAGFVVATADVIPLKSGTADVVVCRGVLPYVDNNQTLGEISRILRPGGIVFLKVLSYQFYFGKFFRKLKEGNVRHVVYSARALMAGTIFNLLGSQPKFLSKVGHTFLTKGTLNRLLAKHGFKITGELPESEAYAPSYILTKVG